MNKNDINKYHQKIDLIKKIKVINEFKENFEKKLIKNFYLVKLDYPLTTPYESDFRSLPGDARTVNFDSKDGKLFYVSNDLTIWLKNKIVDLDLKHKQGIITFNKKINRDEDDFESIETNCLTIELVINEQEKNDPDFYKSIFKTFMSFIKEAFMDISKDLVKNNKFFDQKIILYKDFSKLRKLFLNKQNIIETYTQKYESVLFEKISSLYIDNHSIFNPFREERETTRIFYFLNKVNRKVYSILKIFTRPDFESLKEQCSLSNIKIQNEDFLKEIYLKRTINIEINLNNLFTCVFKEFSNVESSCTYENKEILETYKLKKIKVM